MTTAGDRIGRIVALAALCALLAGVGALGWLVAHVATYDALGRAHEHAGHAYMEPVQRIGGWIAGLGIGLALVVLSLARGPLRALVHQWVAARSTWPWVAAAAVPVASFTIVESVEGSLRHQGFELLALGVALQALIGAAVLAIVRWFVLVVMHVVEFVARAGRRPAPRQAARAPFLPVSSIGPCDLRIAPMASNAALRAPPLLLP